MFKKKMISLFCFGLLLTTCATQAYDLQKMRESIYTTTRVLKNKTLGLSHLIVKGLKIPTKLLLVSAVGGNALATFAFGVYYADALDWLPKNEVVAPSIDMYKDTAILLVHSSIIGLIAFPTLRILNALDNYLTV